MGRIGYNFDICFLDHGKQSKNYTSLDDFKDDFGISYIKAKEIHGQTGVRKYKNYEVSKCPNCKSNKVRIYVSSNRLMYCSCSEKIYTDDELKSINDFEEKENLSLNNIIEYLNDKYNVV